MSPLMKSAYKKPDIPFFSTFRNTQESQVSQALIL